VLEAAVVGVPSELGEDEVMACVTLRQGAQLQPAELLAHCRARMAAFMVPRYIRILAALPKTPTERVQKNELRAQGVTSDTYDGEAS
jgi:crotonobetaine/carnitine-CoA ligase